MNYAALFCIITGLPCLAFGLWLLSAPSAEAKASKKHKHKTKTIGASKAGAAGFILGGLLFSGVGLFALLQKYFQ